jgi:two-component system nitrogen regulation response regulator NtrX
VRGAFTGATTSKRGKFALADGGTIFLDEIGTMAPALQAKLLRVLQEREFEPLGSERTQKVDVRIIAATNRDLRQFVSDGRFQEDLYYRLNVIPIHIAPLRERRDDIPVLVRHFADTFARDNNFRRKTFTAPAMERLKAHQWRGNIRELRNTVERLVIMSNADQVDVGDLRLADAGARVDQAAPAPDNEWMHAPTLHEFKASSERAYLVAKLRENGWNISKTAEVVDTPRSNLYKKLEQYRISQESDG